MAIAAARVQTTIKIDAQDSASKAIERVNKGLGRTGKEAKKVAKDTAKLDRNFSDMNDTAGQGAKDTKEGLEGVREVLGGISPELGTIATGFGGIEKLTKALPGPLGIAAAAVVGVAGGAFLLHKRLSEATAKARELGGTGFAEVRDQLDASVDGAVKLTQAMDDLSNKALRPSIGLLREIRDRAESMGLDGEEAMTAYVEAINKGGDAIKDFGRKFGPVISQAETLVDIAKRLSIDVDLLGIQKTLTTAGKLKKNLEDQQKVRQAIAAEEERIGKLRTTVDHSTEISRKRRLQLTGEIAVVEAKLDKGSRAELRRLEDATVQLNVNMEARRRSAELQREDATAIALLKAQQAATDNDAIKAQIQTQINAVQLAGVERQRRVIKSGILDLSKSEALIEGAKLKIIQAQIRAGDLTRREAAAAKAEALRKKRRAKHLAAVKKRRAAEKAASDEQRKLLIENRKILDDITDRDDRISADLAGAKVERAKSIADARIASALEAGDVERAEGLQRQQDVEEATNAEKAIRAKFAKELAKVNAESRQHIELTKQRELELAQVRADLEEKDAARAVARRERTRKQVQDAVQYLAEVGAAIGPLDSAMGNVAVAAAKAGPAIAKLAIEGKKAAPAAIQAFGQIGSSFVDAELARVNAATQSAAEIAAAKATEAGDTEKAKQIMAQAETEMADEKEKAEKRKAGIMALVSAAQAVFFAASGNWPGAAASAAAAGLYGAIAGGAMGAVQPGGGAGTTAGTVAGAGAAGGAAGGGGGNVVNVNFQRGFVIGTEQTVGRTVQGAVRSLATTGYAAKAGV